MLDSFITSAAMDPLVTLLGHDSPYRGLVMALAAIAILVYVNQIARARLKDYVERCAHKPENAAAFMRIYSGTYRVLMAIVVVSAAGGSFKMLGLTVGFIGTMLGWSLQVPMRGLAAWVMVTLKRPFRVGDRITVAGVTGDVLEVQLNHIFLNQVGGTVQGEERSGRGMLVPTAMLFAEEIINYNYFAMNELDVQVPASKFMLDEVLVRLSFGSDYDVARQLCIAAATQAGAELIGQTDERPFVRSEFLPWGLLIRVRYKTIPVRRQELSSRVTELIWQAFNAHPDQVRFGLPTGVAGLEGVPEQPATTTTGPTAFS